MASIPAPPPSTHWWVSVPPSTRATPPLHDQVCQEPAVEQQQQAGHDQQDDPHDGHDAETAEHLPVAVVGAAVVLLVRLGAHDPALTPRELKPEAGVPGGVQMSTDQ